MGGALVVGNSWEGVDFSEYATHRIMPAAGYDLPAREVSRRVAKKGLVILLEHKESRKEDVAEFLLKNGCPIEADVTSDVSIAAIYDWVKETVRDFPRSTNPYRIDLPPGKWYTLPRDLGLVLGDAIRKGSSDLYWDVGKKLPGYPASHLPCIRGFPVRKDYETCPEQEVLRRLLELMHPISPAVAHRGEWHPFQGYVHGFRKRAQSDEWVKEEEAREKAFYA